MVNIRLNRLNVKTALFIAALFFLSTTQAWATLTTIGTATYLGAEYNLIWDDDNNGKSIVWLDYSSDRDTWDNQAAWVEGLSDDGVLTYNFNEEYSISWTGDWRMPGTVDGERVTGMDGTTTAGYNITTSEMGHLFYEELGETGYYDTAGNQNSGWAITLENKGDFENIQTPMWSICYWSGTETEYDYAGIDNENLAWIFDFVNGNQQVSYKGTEYFAMAVREIQVSTVPVPAAVWLLGSGLLGLIGLRRKRT
jgi:hypothetical protein